MPGDLIFRESCEDQSSALLCPVIHQLAGSPLCCSRRALDIPSIFVFLLACARQDAMRGQVENGIYVARGILWRWRAPDRGD